LKLHQLRYVAEIARQGLSFSAAAQALHTSQPGISKQIQLLESELGVDLFVRSGNRIAEMTEPGRRIAEIAAAILRETESIKSAAREFTAGGAGRLDIAATFTLARYVLPGLFSRFAARYPDVGLNLLQGSSDQVCRMAESGEADIALTARPAREFPDLLLIDYCELPRVLIVPRGHPLARTKRVTLKAIASNPLITLDIGSQGQARMHEVLRASGLGIRNALSLGNVDVVKAFVEAGLGIAIVPQLAFDPARDRRLRALDVGHLFEPHRGCLAIRRNHYLPGFAYDFIETLAPGLDRKRIQEALRASAAGS